MLSLYTTTATHLVIYLLSGRSLRLSAVFLYLTGGVKAWPVTGRTAMGSVVCLRELAPRSLHSLPSNRQINVQDRYYVPNAKAHCNRLKFVHNIFNGMPTKQVFKIFDLAAQFVHSISLKLPQNSENMRVTCQLCRPKIAYAAPPPLLVTPCLAGYCEDSLMSVFCAGVM